MLLQASRCRSSARRLKHPRQQHHPSRRSPHVVAAAASAAEQCAKHRPKCHQLCCTVLQMCMHVGVTVLCGVLLYLCMLNVSLSSAMLPALRLQPHCVFMSAVDCSQDMCAVNICACMAAACCSAQHMCICVYSCNVCWQENLVYRG